MHKKVGDTACQKKREGGGADAGQDEGSKGDKGKGRHLA